MVDPVINLSIRIKRSLRDRLAEEAEREKRSVANMVSVLMEQALNQREADRTTRRTSP